MFTRSKSTISTKSTTSVKSVIVPSTRNNTRLQNRILKLDTTHNDVASHIDSNGLGPAYNTRLALNVLSPKSYCIKSELPKHVYTHVDHPHNTRYSSGVNNVEIDFDEASIAWNSNKRRVGQMYEYTR
jgi:hypothetical protein